MCSSLWVSLQKWGTKLLVIIFLFVLVILGCNFSPLGLFLTGWLVDLSNFTAEVWLLFSMSAQEERVRWRTNSVIGINAEHWHGISHRGFVDL